MTTAVLGALFVIVGIAALCGKVNQPKPAWVHMIYEEHKAKLLERS